MKLDVGGYEFQTSVKRDVDYVCNVYVVEGFKIFGRIFKARSRLDYFRLTDDVNRNEKRVIEIIESYINNINHTQPTLLKEVEKYK